MGYGVKGGAVVAALSTHPPATPTIMARVLLALTPALLTQTVFFGPGVLINTLWCSLLALACEALALTIRQRRRLPILTDGSVLVSAWLIAMSLPPLAPWWLSLIATAAAVLLGKQLYGGLGQNPSNPNTPNTCLLYTSPSPRDRQKSRMPSSA